MLSNITCGLLILLFSDFIWILYRLRIEPTLEILGMNKTAWNPPT
jgi:hypothetical protein